MVSMSDVSKDAASSLKMKAAVFEISQMITIIFTIALQKNYPYPVKCHKIIMITIADSRMDKPQLWQLSLAIPRGYLISPIHTNF